MQCPSCAVVIAFQPNVWQPGSDPVKGMLVAKYMICPSCARAIFVVSGIAGGIDETLIVWPRTTGRPPCPKEVPKNVADDYSEACLVHQDSPKASAALSRRCLQHILRDAAKVKQGNLSTEIDQVLATNVLPGSVAEALDAVREIGNFAAHPTKSSSTGEVIDVEPGEAEWNLDVVEALMDIYYVQPAKLVAKKAALNQKLADAGKGSI
jgi:hypothetical protein